MSVREPTPPASGSAHVLGRVQHVIGRRFGDLGSTQSVTVIA